MEQKKYAKCVCCGVVWHISIYQKSKEYYCPYCQHKRRTTAERKKRNEK